MNADFIDKAGLHVRVVHAFKQVGHIGRQVLDLLHRLHKGGVHEGGFAPYQPVVEPVAAVEGGPHPAQEGLAAPSVLGAVGQGVVTRRLAGFQVFQKFIPGGGHAQAQLPVHASVVKAEHGLTHGGYAIHLAVGNR